MNNGLLKGEIYEVWGKGKWQNLFAPVDIAGVVLFRIAFGGIMFWEFADYLKKEYQIMGKDVKVYVDALASLNGRKYQHIIDPNIALATQPKPNFGYASWIMPLTTELSEQKED